jgi:two-component system NtrC family sensor kinase
MTQASQAASRSALAPSTAPRGATHAGRVAGLERGHRALRVLGAGGDALLRARGEAELLHHVCRIAVDVGGYRLAWVGYAEQDVPRAVRPVASAGDAGYLTGIRVTWADDPHGRGPVGTAVRTGAPVIVQRVTEDPRFEPWREAAARHGFGSVLGLPLRADGAAFGALAIYAAEADAFDPEETELLRRLADNLAYGIVALRTRAEQQHAEDALRRSEARFRALIENAQDIITLLDGSGVILYASPAVERVLGYRPDELVGRSVSELLHPDDARAVAELRPARAHDAGRTAALELRVRHRDGTWRILCGSGTDCLDDPAVGGVVVNARDVTERKHAEAELAKQRDALMQSEKLAAMSVLLAGVAHELNNPLAVVVGRATLLGQQLAGSPLGASAEKLGQAAERCARIVKNFLALARQHPPERQRVHLSQVVQEALELVAYALRVDGVEVALDLSLGLPVLWADPHQLHQVVVNLVSNAHHAMREVPLPQRRRLTLRTHADAAGEVVTLEVADTGPGILPEVRPRLFEPFFTTKPLGQGTGLGLSLCRGIVEAHGGRITLESEPGHGATFRVELPVHAAPAPPPSDADRAVEARVRHRRILVVDDEPEVARLVADILRDDGQHVETAADGRTALEKLGQRPFDLVVSDLRMPEIDGPGLFREVARRHPALARRMVFLTGDTLGPEPQRFLEETGAPSVNKPFTPDDLRRVVHQALRTG